MQCVCELHVLAKNAGTGFRVLAHWNSIISKYYYSTRPPWCSGRASARNARGREFDTGSRHTKYVQIGTFCFPTFARSQGNGPSWVHISICGIVPRWATTIKLATTGLAQPDHKYNYTKQLHTWIVNETNLVSLRMAEKLLIRRKATLDQSINQSTRPFSRFLKLLRPVFKYWGSGWGATN